MDKEVQKVDLSPNLIWKANYGKDVSKLQERASTFLSKITDHGEVEREGGITSTGHTDAPHLWPEMIEFCNDIEPYVKKVLDAWELNYNWFGITKSWVNKHNVYQWTDTHDHGDAHMVLSFYLKQPQKGGNLEFTNINKHLWGSYPRHPHGKTKLHEYYTEVEAKQGDIIFFPGWLSHRSQPNQSNQERIVMGLNIHAELQRPEQLSNEHIEKNI